MADILDVEQIISEAQDAYRAGEYQAAVQFFKVAEESFETQDDLARAAEMKNNQSVVLLKMGKKQAAFDVVDPTISIFEHSGDKKYLAMAYGNRAAALDALGDTESAISDYQFAADQFKRTGENDLYAHTMQAISAIQLRTGKSLEALATMQAGIGKIEHPNLKHRVLKKILNLPFRLLNR